MNLWTPVAAEYRLTMNRYEQNGEVILPARWQTAFNTVSSVGQFFSCFLCSTLSDRIGRKGGLFVGLVFFDWRYYW